MVKLWEMYLNPGFLFAPVGGKGVMNNNCVQFKLTSVELWELLIIFQIFSKKKGTIFPEMESIRSVIWNVSDKI